MADVMSNTSYLSLAGLQYYDGKIKAFIGAADDALQNEILGTIATDAAVTGKYVSRVYADNGVIKVERTDLPAGYELPAATASDLGGVKIGGNVNVESDGTISVNTATDAQLGVAQAGMNIDVANGVFSVKTASASQLGVAQAGENINVASGVFSVNTATAAQPGVAQAGTNIDVTDGVFSVKTASDAQLGLAQAGTNINVSNGVFSVPAASASVAGVMSAADYSKLAAFSQASDYALKSDIATAYIYRGSVADEAHLPTDDVHAGDVYNTEDTGMNFAYNGTAWDALGSTFEVDAIANTDIDALFA